MEKSEVQSGFKLNRALGKEEREEWRRRVEGREGEREKQFRRRRVLTVFYRMQAHSPKTSPLPLRAGLPVGQVSLEHLFQPEDVLSYNHQLAPVVFLA